MLGNLKLVNLYFCRNFFFSSSSSLCARNKQKSHFAVFWHRSVVERNRNLVCFCPASPNVAPAFVSDFHNSSVCWCVAHVRYLLSRTSAENCLYKFFLTLIS